MNLLQNLTHTIYFALEGLKVTYPGLILQYGFPATAPAGLVIALEHDKTKVDTQHELAGYRRRPRVFLADIYAPNQLDRNNLCEGVKNLFENKNMPVRDSSRQPVRDSSHQDAEIVMAGEGVRVEVDLDARFKARARIYVYTLVD